MTTSPRSATAPATPHRPSSASTQASAARPASANDRARLVVRALKYRYKLDPAEVRATRSIVRPGMFTLDLGAHKGAYAYWLAKAVGRGGRVVCVEPQERLAAKLTGLMAPWPHASVRWAALSTSTGTGTLSLRADGSSHGAAMDGFPDEDGRKVDVPIITLGDLIDQEGLPGLDFIKCDIEGHEVAAFAAGIDTIRAHTPVILVECEERKTRPGSTEGLVGVTGLTKLFEAEGYRVRYFKGGVLRPVSAFDVDADQTYGVGEFCNNFLLDHPSKPANV